MNDLLRILGLWRQQRVWLVAGGVISVAALAAGVGVMTLAGQVIGAALVTGVVGASLLLDSFGVARVILRYAERLVTHDATFRALTDLRVWLFRKLAANAAGGLGFRRAGDVLARLVGDVAALDGLYLRILVPLAGAFLLLVALLVLQGGIAAWVVGVFFVLAALVLPWRAARATMVVGEKLAEAASALRVVVVDAVTGLREVRAFGAEGRMLAAVQGKESVLLGTQHELARRAALAGAGAVLCGQAALLAALMSGGASPIGTVACVFLVVAAFEAVSGLTRAGTLAGHAVAASRRVLEAADAPPPVPDPVIPTALPADVTLSFEAVHFRWRSDHPPVFEGLTLEVPSGARVALLGPSGAGKSTLAALALKLAAPQSGRVLLGGTDLADLSAEQVQRRIGLLSQATHLFDDTIRHNLLLARPVADESALWRALDAARIGDFVRSLPDRLESWVGEGGTRFSGGQGRRLALARALLSPAPVLILDEPCSGLDAETEREFLSTLNEVAQGRSVILIAHRLTGVERLDRIWRLSARHAVAAAA
jgi:ATP-binding cassette subfamily C protein CydC